jgi:hypothetical protein
MAWRKESMMVTKELRVEIRQKREPAVLIDGKLVPGSVPFIRHMLETVVDPHDRDDLLGELAGEYLRADLDDEHLLVQRERVANHPDAAVMWLGLAHSLSMRKDGSQEAKVAAAKAVEMSRRAGALIRYALTCQAEVARKTNDSELFARALRDLIEDAPNARPDDSRLDIRIVESLPSGFCAPTLEEKYREALKNYG